MLIPPSLNPASPHLSLDALTAPKEKSYFIPILIVSILVWGFLALSLVGLLYAVLIGFFLWLGNGLLIAYLRSEAVRVGPDQLPELDAAFKDVCAHLGLRDIPALYVLQSGGLLNAFATRFAGRDFVVVYSDFLEALGPTSSEMRFVLGHEIGHIKSRHILKQIFLAPGLFFPLLGPAYRRAWETSCDRYGAFAAQDIDAATRAMLVISGGRQHGPSLNPVAFANQHTTERGFFVSLHELTSTYPTLTRRVTDLMALRDGRSAPAPSRSPFAYIVALFFPGGSSGASGPLTSMLIVIVIMGFLAAMAVPAFQKVREASQARMCVNNQHMLVAALEQYRLEHGTGASKWDDVAGPNGYLPQMPVCPSGGTYNGAPTEDGTYQVTCTVAAHDPAALPHRR